MSYDLCTTRRPPHGAAELCPIGNGLFQPDISFNQFSTTINNTSDDESQIHAWLSRLDPQVRHQDIGSQRMDDVGAWLLETGEFKSWYGGGGGSESNQAALFWCGNPGVGKSYIT